MVKQLYTLLIAPRQQDVDIRNREVVLNVLLAGTLLILLLALMLLIGNIIAVQKTYMTTRTLGVAGVTLFVGSLYWLSRTGWHKTTSFLLVGIYFALATSLVYHWGINIPTGILLYGLVIVLSGILLGPRYSLWAAAIVCLTLTVIEQLAEHGVITQNWSWTTTRASMIDVAGFSLIFGVIALVSWLFNHQMERSLHQAERAEAALTKQKSLLETTVEKRTQQLQAAQLEKIQQMYRFAELGQLSTALLHDLANHLTSLTLDIQGLEGQTRSRALQRAKRSISYIDNMVLRVRDQLHGRSQIRPFNVANEIEAMVHMLNHKAAAAGVTLRWQSPEDKRHFRSRGEPIRFRQLMANLISNAIDAYDRTTTRDNPHAVSITLTADDATLTITVTDWGKGIPRRDRAKLFEPFYSTKKTGMGMGLFIVKQIAEEHFLGSAGLDRSTKFTAFTIKLPKAK